MTEVQSNQNQQGELLRETGAESAVEKASGRSRMLGQDMVTIYEANGGCAGEELKAIK